MGLPSFGLKLNSIASFGKPGDKTFAAVYAFIENPKRIIMRLDPAGRQSVQRIQRYISYKRARKLNGSLQLSEKAA